MDGIRVEKLSHEAVVAIASRLRDDQGQALIDFSALKPTSTLWALALANVMLRAPEPRFDARLPHRSDSRPLALLARTGLLFALAQRRDGDEGSWRGLSEERARWRTVWRRSDTDQRQRLFHPEDSAPETQEKAHLASFVNPHVEGAPGVEVEVANRNLRPWLMSHLRERKGRLTTGREELAVKVSDAALELIENIVDWAGLQGKRDHSLVQVHMTRGERTNVYLTAFDTGEGIIPTSQGRMPQLFTREGEAWTPTRAVEAMLDGDGRVSHGRGRGQGLHRVRELVNDYSGKLQILTNSQPHTDAHRAGLLVVDRGTTGTSIDEVAGIPYFRGTIVHASFHLEATAAAKPEGQERVPALAGAR